MIKTGVKSQVLIFWGDVWAGKYIQTKLMKKRTYWRVQMCVYGNLTNTEPGTACPGDSGGPLIRVENEHTGLQKKQLWWSVEIMSLCKMINKCDKYFSSSSFMKFYLAHPNKPKVVITLYYAMLAQVQSLPADWCDYRVLMVGPLDLSLIYHFHQQFSASHL